MFGKEQIKAFCEKCCVIGKELVNSVLSINYLLTHIQTILFWRERRDWKEYNEKLVSDSTN